MLLGYFCQQGNVLFDLIIFIRSFNERDGWLDHQLEPVIRLPDHKKREYQRACSEAEHNRAFKCGHQPAEKINPGVTGICILVNLQKKNPVISEALQGLANTVFFGLAGMEPMPNRSRISRNSCAMRTFFGSRATTENGYPSATRRGPMRMKFPA